jgi:hypothetical protein
LGFLLAFIQPGRKDARMKTFYFGPVVLLLALTLFFCGCANQPGQTQSTQQSASTTSPSPFPQYHNTGNAGGMRGGY